VQTGGLTANPSETGWFGCKFCSPIVNVPVWH